MKNLLLIAGTSLILSGFTVSKQNETSNNNPLSVTAQTAVQDMFGYFRIHRQAGNVVLNWGISSPQGVAGFTIERSYDGDFFEVINQAACSNSVKFSFKDMSVFPGTIYYRIGCVMNDNNIHYTPVETIRIVKHG